MVHILGTLLPDSRFTKAALTFFYGIGSHTAARICARYQIHDRSRVRDLTPTQITELASFLSSPSTTPAMPTLPLAAAHFKPPARAPPLPELSRRQREGLKKEPLKDLKIETELRRQVRENIAHQRLIGSYVGRRHAMALPVRGQRTKSNAKTAAKLNRIERRG
ncbi:mitochondrial 30S ribosomal protein S13 [Hysterangium stoloniferum]|nr:mitochondrial 30S ribosomal protein S13 [Hysterangium stoloniferum]